MLTIKINKAVILVVLSILVLFVLVVRWGNFLDLSYFMVVIYYFIKVLRANNYT